jgi:dienelactone hydrolase
MQLLAVVLSISIAGAAPGSDSQSVGSLQVWGKLAKGPFAVGFRSLWQLDYGRAYNTVFDDKSAYATGKAPKPILVVMWYPADKSSDAQPMTHRDYLKIETEDPRLAKFSAKLAEYERAIIGNFLTGKPDQELTETDRRRLEDVWNTPTASRRDAPSLDGRFPLVIYHPGAKSSYEDNAVLCEFLASHGYFVIGSSFSDAGGASLEVDGGQGSARDLEFLIAYARRMQNVDWHHIGLVGHSLGAQAILLYCAQDGSPVDAVVSLDTTQDYDSLGTPGWEYLTKPLLESPKNLKMPLLMVANAHAVFELADSLKYCERLYMTLADQKHNDFVSEGIVRHIVDCAAKPDDAACRARLETARAGYEAICTYTLEFFNVHLKNHASERTALLATYSQNKLGGPAPHVDHVPAGVSAPEAYHDNPEDAPTPRQIRPLLAVRGLAPSLELLRAWHQKAPSSPIFHADFGFSLIDEDLDKGRKADAVAVFRLYASFDQSFARSFVREGDKWRRHRINRLARDYYQKALVLDSADSEAAERLKSLGEPKRD